MKKRSVSFGDYVTAEYGWTLAVCKLSDPKPKQKYVEKTAGDGSWDWTAVLTDGVPTYKDRTLTVSLECSEGTRDDREELINDLTNLLDGLKWKVVLPDRPDHYLIGRLSVAVEYSDLAHARVTVTGICEPYFYSKKETLHCLPAANVAKSVRIRNDGRKTVIPTLAGPATVVCNGKSIVLGTEETTWSEMVLKPGITSFEYVGEALTIRYREAVLR